MAIAYAYIPEGYSPAQKKILIQATKKAWYGRFWRIGRPFVCINPRNQEGKHG